MILALTLALAIGFSLALLGSGGSIITLPVLVYAARVPAPQAVGMSLAVVGGTTLVASLLNARRGLERQRAIAPRIARKWPTKPARQLTVITTNEVLLSAKRAILSEIWV